MGKKRANGEGSIRKRKDGRWEGFYTASYDPATGKQKIKNVLGKTQAEVRWDIIVGAALLYGYMTLFISLLHKTGYRLRMLLQTLVGIGLIVVIDGVLGFQKWSLAYVLPGALVLLDIAVVILMLANGRNWQSYIPVEILILVLSLIPPALYQAGIGERIEAMFLEEIAGPGAVLATLKKYLG